MHLGHTSFKLTKFADKHLLRWELALVVGRWLRCCIRPYVGSRSVSHWFFIDSLARIDARIDTLVAQTGAGFAFWTLPVAAALFAATIAAGLNDASNRLVGVCYAIPLRACLVSAVDCCLIAVIGEAAGFSAMSGRQRRRRRVRHIEVCRHGWLSLTAAR